MLFLNARVSPVHDSERRDLEPTLLVCDEMFRAGDHSRILDSLHGLGHGNTGKIGVGGEALPVATPCGGATYGSCNRT